MTVTAVQGIDARHVEISVQVPGPAPSCARDLRATTTDSDQRTVWVQVLFDGGDTCTSTRIARTVATVPSLGRRQLVVDQQPWARAGTTGFRACTGPFGCSAPPANHCDPAYIRLAAHTGELPPERSWQVLGCTARYLVLDVSAAVTGCQPLDGASAPAGCTAHRVRWFLRFDPVHWWTVVAAGKGAGCASVHAVVPAFPAALCEHLGPAPA